MTSQQDTCTTVSTFGKVLLGQKQLGSTTIQSGLLQVNQEAVILSDGQSFMGFNIHLNDGLSKPRSSARSITPLTADIFRMNL